jgi:acetyl-CoA carboxylase carboxyl transferase subunit beta
MAWFDDLKTPKIKNSPSPERPSSKVPEGLWEKCPSCGELLQAKVLSEQNKVCPSCQYHFRLTVEERIVSLLDAESFKEFSRGLSSKDPLKFEDIKPYSKRLQEVAEKRGRPDGLVCGEATIDGLPVVIGIFDFQFMGGSMGVVVGEKVALVLERALEKKRPAILITASGGARMQEGIFSLLQMAKTSAVINRLREAGIPLLTLLTDPTTGGVAASFATLGDVIFAEPGALIGFAGPRVIAQTIRQQLPKDAQRSEFLLRHGFIDRVVHRADLRREVSTVLKRLGKATCESS